MPTPAPLQHRRNLHTVFAAALRAVHGRRCVREFLRHRSFSGGMYLVAVGKAAGAMTQGAIDILGQRIRRGLVITRHGHVAREVTADRRLTVIEAGHPFPDRHSLLAGERLLEFLAAAPADAQFLLLVSGGASSLVEVLPPGLTLADLERANQWLVTSGLPIDRINAVRKRLSMIKGGRLARHLGGRRALNLLLSDVPGDDPSVIGSGLLVPAGAAGDPGDEPWPGWLRDMLESTVPYPDHDDPVFGQVETRVIAGGADCRRAAAAAMRQLGYTPVVDHEDGIKGDVMATARRLVDTVRSGPPGVHVWSGETTIRLPEVVGRGGRNQHLALAIARLIAGDAALFFLAGATDGSDGSGNAAGALVDGDTVRRGAAGGFDAAASLAAADAGTFLAASGDLLTGGPTGTNVADLIIGVRAA